MFRRKPSHTNPADDSASRDAKVSELRMALGPLSGRSLKFCTDACLKRYLEARNWNLDKAKKMLEETLKWRSTYKPEEIRWVIVLRLFPSMLYILSSKLCKLLSNSSKSVLSIFAVQYTHHNVDLSLVQSILQLRGYIWLVLHNVIRATFYVYVTWSSVGSSTILNFNGLEMYQHEVAHESETGNVFKANFHDRLGRTVLIMRPGKQNTSSPEGNIRHLVYLMENAILNLPEGQERMSWLIDFNGWSLNTNISIRTARDIIYILQNHYPERLAIVVLYSPPRFFEAFWKVVKYFIDAKTFEKIKFVYPNNKDSVELMKTFFDAENLPSEFGGKTTLNYDHEEFSRLMAQEDVKTAKFWGFDDVTSHTNDDGYPKAKVTPAPVTVASAAT